MADDFESILQIEPSVKEECPSVTRDDLINRLLLLIKEGLVRERSDELLTKAHILRDLQESKDSWCDYWFGMTVKGGQCWEATARTYGFEANDWSESFCCRKDLVKGELRVVADTPEQVLATLEQVLDPGMIVDRTTFQYNQIRWRPKYYVPERSGWALVCKFSQRPAG